MEKTLVVLAAGMGSRFGGSKQTFPVGPNGEFIMDYSIYSAIKHGFNKIVFVIKKEDLEIVEETIGKRIEDKVNVEYVFQRLSDLPFGFEVPEGRVKPWGTAHAIYAAKHAVTEKFAVCTADDFYGDDAFRVLSEYLDKNDGYVIVGYPVASTMSENGSVKRGVIISDNNKVTALIESACIKENDHVKCTPLDKSKDEFTIDNNHPVSMLLNGFNKSILDTIEKDMVNNFNNNKDNLLNYEMLLPDIIDEEIKRGKVVDVISTTSKWMGVTYREDAVRLQNFIKSEIENGTYPEKLWDDSLDIKLG